MQHTPAKAAAARRVGAEQNAMTDFELTTSIINKCPALRLPQSFVEKLGMTAQIVALKGATPEVAQYIVDACNEFVASRTGTGKDPLGDSNESADRVLLAREMYARAVGEQPCAPFAQMAAAERP